MKIEDAISEPCRRLIEFHNRFNRNIKVTFGSIALAEQAASSNGTSNMDLPTGEEPWGQATQWSNLPEKTKDSAIFVSELGLVRASSAFEDYLIGAKAEFDRARLKLVGGDSNGDDRGNLTQLIALLDADAEKVSTLRDMVNFFEVARNCVAHRSNRANKELVELRYDENLTSALSGWAIRKNSKWKVNLPDIILGKRVEWRPRHAILASDTYYRCAVFLDRLLVERLGEEGLVNMAAHWSLLSKQPAPTNGRRSPENIVRGMLVGRYCVTDVGLPEVIGILKRTDRWDRVRAAFHSKFHMSSR
jgi:hypothetical protein